MTEHEERTQLSAEKSTESGTGRADRSMPSESTLLEGTGGVRRAGSIPDFGPFRVQERIGEGGMGEVYRAEQTKPIRRVVALKVIKPGMDSREVIARFESERQALALMNHPGIAKVFDAGTTPDGRPYFAMELIQGIPITDYVDQHRLGTRARLELFVKVCDAVQHAHQKAILHRDLKPSNVLVAVEGTTPQPKVIDFGISKALSQRLTDKTLYTELGRFLGTPEYMSPEQAQADGEGIDTRSDIYSLGVILYELLAGARPFDRRSLQGGVDELRRLIREDDPPRPSTRVTTIVARSPKQPKTHDAPTRQTLRGDLDWITMKALEKNPNRRYATASELARDIDRHLRDVPVLASPPSGLYRLRKFVRRHRTGVAVAALSLLAVVGGLIATTFGLVTLQRERDETERARAEAEQVTQFLSDMLESADPSQSGRQITVPEMLDRASEQIGPAFSNQPLVEARLRGTIGNTYQALGLYDRASRQMPTVVAIRERELGPDHAATLSARRSLANLYLDMGQLTEAEREFQRLVTDRERLYGPDHEDTLWARFNLATVFQASERLDEAETMHRAIHRSRLATLGPEHPATLDSVEQIATIHWSRGEAAIAGEMYESVYEGRRRQLGAEHPKTLDVLNNLATVDHIEGRYAAAEKRYREALDAGRRVRGELHPETLVSLGNLGELYGDIGRFEQAEATLLETLDGKERVLGSTHPSTEYTRSVLQSVRERALEGGRE